MRKGMNGTDTSNCFCTQVLCRVLSFLDPQDLLFCRLVKKDINRTIKSHFILNATLNEENLSRSWSDGLLLPWSYRRKRNLAHVLETDTIFNKIRYLRVGKLKMNFDGSLKNVSATVQHIEFTKPVARKNIDKIMKECTACTILTVHTSVFIGKRNSLWWLHSQASSMNSNNLFRSKTDSLLLPLP